MWYILLVVVLFLIIYNLYFKDYIEVKKSFNILNKTLDTRDLLVMKLVPELKSKSERADIVKLIELRMKNKKSSFNNQIKIDVELNEKLKNMYLKLEKNKENLMLQATLKNTLEIENTLKKLRTEYNLTVEKYNMNLVMHKFICMRIVRMKPLDTYGKSYH